MCCALAALLLALVASTRSWLKAALGWGAGWATASALAIGLVLGGAGVAAHALGGEGDLAAAMAAQPICFGL